MPNSRKCSCINKNEMRQRKIAILCDFVPDRYWILPEELSECLNCECDVYSKKLNHLHGSSIKNAIRILMYVFIPLKWLRLYAKYDAVIAWQQFYGIGLAFWLRLLKFKKKADIVVMTFIHNPKRGLVGKLYRHFVTYALNSGFVSRIVVYSSSEVDLYSDMLRIPKNRFLFIPYGLPEHKTPEFDSELSSKRYVFATGRSNRDYDVLLAAATGTFTLIIACDELQVKDYGDNITILPSTYGDEMHKYMYNSTIVAIPLKNADVSSGQLVFLQAMQYGKVILCSDCPAVNDYLEDGRNAILVKRKEQWAEEITRVMNDNELCTRLSETAKSDFYQRYSERIFARSIAKVLSMEQPV